MRCPTRGSSRRLRTRYSQARWWGRGLSNCAPIVGRPRTGEGNRPVPGANAPCAASPNEAQAVAQPHGRGCGETVASTMQDDADDAVVGAPPGASAPAKHPWRARGLRGRRMGSQRAGGANRRRRPPASRGAHPAREVRSLTAYPRRRSGVPAPPPPPRLGACGSQREAR